HAGRVLVSDTPAAIAAQRGVATLEEAFIAHLLDAGGGQTAPAAPGSTAAPADAARLQPRQAATPRRHPLRRRLREGASRIWSYAWREALELMRDPVRGALALLGSLLLMFVMGYGINMDVE